MKKIDGFKIEQVPHSNIAIVVTSEPDYEMDRVMLVEDYPDYQDFTIVQGGHCSCYGFDEVQWEVITYTKEEAIKLATGWQESRYGAEPIAAPLMLAYLSRC